MAAVDVSRVVALTYKADTLASRGHWARAAEIYAEAVAAAQALHQPDCVIVAYLQASQANALLGHAHTAGVPEARRVELMRSAFLQQLLPAAMASLERRMAAGTLLAGTCRPHEVAWNTAKTAHGNAVAANIMPNALPRALELCGVATDVDAAARTTLSLPEASAVACSTFVASAFDMIQRRTGAASMPEAALVRDAQSYIEEQRFIHATTSREWHARILAAWRRLQSSGVLQRRGILQGVSLNDAFVAHATAAAAAAAAARGLHFCSLHTCGAQEVHASQFKRCSACSGVVYCCKEHQVQDWPAHKAACRAARKAAEQADDKASGA
jgi:hypothetical protein